MLRLKYQPTHPHAIAAIRATQYMHAWGDWVTLRYLEKRQCPPKLFALAMLLKEEEELFLDLDMFHERHNKSLWHE